ncbi:MAG: helix-turn-helix transcriptional regulator [Alphaproteobacteria bacterium]|nr:helix-turn-helix transcriptional regulator [Alphaproteobacteria bacterium]MBQ9235109.1 helix-turn-helix transcriptional regulator [Alphaproteobacteria bacterium]
MTDKQQEVRDFLENTAREKGFSLNSLSLRLGKNPTYLFHFVKRHSPRRLDEQSRRKLAQILDVAEQKLCDYALPDGIIGSPLPASGLIQDKLSTISGLLGLGKDKINLKPIEVIDMEGQAKGGFAKLRGNVTAVEYLAPEVLAMYGINNPDNVKILKNVGDAMAPTIGAGDMVWLDMSYNTASDGIYLIGTQNNALLRRLQVNPFNNSLEVSADNPTYKSFGLDNADNVEIIGKVIWTMRKM